MIRVHYVFLLSLLQWEIAHGSTDLGVPDPKKIEYPSDPPSDLEIELGKKLFFDQRLSKNKNQSCGTCHNPDLGFGDGMALGLGTDGNLVGRNAPHLYNLGFASTFAWDGRFSSLEEQALAPIIAKDEMAMSFELLMKRLNKVEFYREGFKKAYGRPMDKELILKAIAAFERSIVSNDSPFDRYLKGDRLALSPEAQRGLALFKGKANCILCHNGVNLTNEGFHNIGLNTSDVGRGKLLPSSKRLHRAFKTPGLRNVQLTAPYMHNGSIGSLEGVIDFYNRGGDVKEGRDPLIRVLHLSNQEKSDLIQFLGALTGASRMERPSIPEDDS